MAPLARLQYTLEQHRNGTAFIPTAGSPGFLLSTQPPTTDGDNANGAADNDIADNDAVSGGPDVAHVVGGGSEEDAVGIVPVGEQGWIVGENQSRLLPPVVVPQVRRTVCCCHIPLVRETDCM